MNGNMEMNFFRLKITSKTFNLNYELQFEIYTNGENLLTKITGREEIGGK